MSGDITTSSSFEDMIFDEAISLFHEEPTLFDDCNSNHGKMVVEEDIDDDMDDGVCVVDNVNFVQEYHKTLEVN